MDVVSQEGNRTPRICPDVEGKSVKLRMLTSGGCAGLLQKAPGLGNEVSDFERLD